MTALKTVAEARDLARARMARSYENAADVADDLSALDALIAAAKREALQEAALAIPAYVFNAGSGHYVREDLRALAAKVTP